VLVEWHGDGGRDAPTPTHQPERKLEVGPVAFTERGVGGSFHAHC